MYDFTGHGEDTFKPIPAGKYLVKVTEATDKESKLGYNLINLEFVIQNGQFEKRSLYKNFLMYHPNPEVVKIAKDQLAQLILANNKKPGVVSSSQFFVGMTATANVKITKDSDGREHNEISYFEMPKAQLDERLPF